MDEKGANTFPFHNLPPEPEKISKGLSCAFLPFLLDKRKVGGDFFYTQKCDQNAKHQVSSPTVSHVEIWSKDIQQGIEMVGVA